MRSRSLQLQPICNLIAPVSEQRAQYIAPVICEQGVPFLVQVLMMLILPMMR
jgi:hypothetical protein